MSKSNLPRPSSRGLTRRPYKFMTSNVELVMPNGKKAKGIFIVDQIEINRSNSWYVYSPAGRHAPSRTEVTCKLFRKVAKGKAYQPLHPNLVFNIYIEVEDSETGTKVPMCIKNAKVVAQERDSRGLEKLWLKAESVTIGEGAEKKVIREPFVFR